jgi:hypothetical protein
MTDGNIKTLVALVIGTIAKEDTFFGPKFKFP